MLRVVSMVLFRQAVEANGRLALIDPVSLVGCDRFPDVVRECSLYIEADGVDRVAGFNVLFACESTQAVQRLGYQVFDREYEFGWATMRITIPAIHLPQPGDYVISLVGLDGGVLGKRPLIARLKASRPSAGGECR